MKEHKATEPALETSIISAYQNELGNKHPPIITSPDLGTAQDEYQTYRNAENAGEDGINAVQKARQMWALQTSLNASPKNSTSTTSINPEIQALYRLAAKEMTTDQRFTVSPIVQKETSLLHYFNKDTITSFTVVHDTSLALGFCHNAMVEYSEKTGKFAFLTKLNVYSQSSYTGKFAFLTELKVYSQSSHLAKESLGLAPGEIDYYAVKRPVSKYKDLAAAQVATLLGRYKKELTP